MILADQLLLEISRRNTDYVAKVIGNDTDLFNELMDLLFLGKPPLPLRASWVVSTVTDIHPGLLAPYTTRIIKNLKSFSHTGVHRNLLRQLAKTEVTEELQGELFDLCYQWLFSRNEPPAVKVHCMQILFNISEKEPDLKPELRLVFEELIQHESAAIRSRSRQLLLKC